MSPALRTGTNRSHKKEAFYVRIVLPDGSSQFMPATDYIGRQMPFEKPRETCAVRVYDDVVTFSLLHVSKKRAATLHEKPIEMPSGMLTRLARRSAEIGDIAPGDLVIERGTDLYRYKVELDATKVGSLEPVGDEVSVELDLRGERLSLYMMSPSSGRLLALAFIGHLGKPGDPETLTRLASKVLNAALALPTFQLLAELETVAVPSKPGLITPTSVINAATIVMPVRLFADPATPDAAPAPVAAGSIGLEIDLQHTTSANERLMFQLVPDERLEPLFAPYLDVATRFVASQIPLALGDELRAISIEIALGEVEASTVERLEELLNAGFAGGVDLTPTRCRAAQIA